MGTDSIVPSINIVRGNTQRTRSTFKFLNKILEGKQITLRTVLTTSTPVTSVMRSLDREQLHPPHHHQWQPLEEKASPSPLHSSVTAANLFQLAPVIFFISQYFSIPLLALFFILNYHFVNLPTDLSLILCTCSNQFHLHGVQNIYHYSLFPVSCTSLYYLNSCSCKTSSF